MMEHLGIMQECKQQKEQIYILFLNSKRTQVSILSSKENKKAEEESVSIGELVDYEDIDKKYLKECKRDDKIEIEIYQFEALHKKINGALNVVIIFSKNLTNGKTTHTILFSTDLKQHYQKIIDYYSLRFQIEFNFRDAKQFFGLEDFMNIKKRRIHNFANLSMFMNNISYLIYKESGFDNYSVNDIKSLFMAEKYTREILKFYGKKVDDILIGEAIRRISAFSLIHGDVA